jgi:RimJ/RimL family protein N-acetyltransferase
MTVMAHNHRAIDVYKRAGFVVEGVKRGAILVDGEPVDEWMMAKVVPAPE